MGTAPGVLKQKLLAGCVLLPSCGDVEERKAFDLAPRGSLRDIRRTQSQDALQC